MIEIYIVGKTEKVNLHISSFSKHSGFSPSEMIKRNQNIYLESINPFLPGNL